MNKPKPRETQLVVDFRQPTRIDGIGITHDNKVEFLQNGIIMKPQRAYLQTGYKKSSGYRKLSIIDLDGHNLFLDSHNVFEKSYDLLFAIDTNTRTIGDCSISVTCVVLCQAKRLKDQRKSFAKYAPVHWFEFRNIDGRPENFAWKFIIERIIGNPEYERTIKVCLIVDADRGNIEDFNTRRKPIFGDFYLPDNFTLVYAYAGSSRKEYLPNILISACDKESHQLMKHIEENISDTSNLIASQDEPYSHFRNWEG